MKRILSILISWAGFALLFLGALFSAQAQPYEPPDTLWTRTFQYDGGVNIRGALFLPNGRIVITGHLADTGLGQGLFFLVLTATGQAIDFDLYPDDMFIVGGGFATQTSDGGFALAGTLAVPNNSDFRIVKLDSNGEFVWERDYPMLGIQEAGSIIGLPDGDLLLGGSSGSASQPTRLFWMKIDGETGDTLWTRQLDQHPAFVFGITSMAVDRDGSYLLLGSTNYADSTNQSDFLLVKSSSEGEVVFARLYGRDLTDRSYGITPIGEGDHILGGNSGIEGPQGAVWQAYHVRVDSNGDTLWTRAGVFGNGLFDQTHEVLPASGGGFYSIGRTAASGYEMRVSRHDSAGVAEWIGYYGSTIGGTRNNAGAVDTLGRIAVAYVPVGDELVVLMTENDPALSTDGELPRVPQQTTEIVAYPNPFNAITTLAILAPPHVVADVTIVNLLGQTVAAPFHGRVNQSPLLLRLDGVILSSGAYFALLQTDQSIISTRLILLK